ncbi:SDR family oxidoreductase [Actinomadura sp. ATCC 31491]|uniref:SDR family oxidoreductase n=1 Tax=Actinomadura luzonensis TaxID=2805427 RepID=A0ABT0G906_9ACTN|nr:SDR family oxidoreductase [Actinomadura luzonensis]MCK2221079.1 SDR family oxidoreductase [Actinomadura luzonensis]
MRIVGSGFLAGHLSLIAHRHHDVVVFAAGVSRSGSVSHDGFDREAEAVRRTLDRCRAAGDRLVYFSTASSAVYGPRLRLGTEDGGVAPTSAYGRHKLAMEALISRHGAAHLILRLAYPAGPGQRSHQFLPAMVRQVAGGSVRVSRGARRDLIDVRDVVTIVDALLTAGVSDEVVNVASGFAAPVEDIVRHLEHRLGRVCDKQYADVPPDPPVSIAKLRALAPAVDGLGFHDAYYRAVVDRYLSATAAPADVETLHGTTRRAT